MTKIFRKSKKPYFGTILGPFWPNLGKNEFAWKTGLCQFLNIPIIYHRPNTRKNWWPIPVELTDGQTNGDDPPQDRDQISSVVLTHLSCWKCKNKFSHSSDTVSLVYSSQKAFKMEFFPTKSKLSNCRFRLIVIFKEKSLKGFNFSLTDEMLCMNLWHHNRYHFSEGKV